MKNTIILLLTGLFCLPFSGHSQSAPTEKQLAALDRVAAPHRQKVIAVLEADKSGQYQQYLADLKALQAESDRQTQKELVGKIQQKHSAFIKGAFTTAKIDLAAMRRQFAEVLGHNKFAMDDFGSISSLPPLQKFQVPLSFDQQLQCPLDQEEEFSSQGGVAKCNASIGTCVISLGAGSEFAGGCRTKGSLGGKFELPSGNFQKVTVSSQFDFDYWGFAYGAAGYGQFNVKVGLRLKGPGIDKVEILHDAWCIAPVLFVSVLELNASNYVAQAVYSGNFSGGATLTAMAYNEAFAFGAGLGAGAGNLGSENFDFVRVKGNE